MPQSPPHIAGSRQVEPRRRRKRTPSDVRRKERRTLEQIQAKARERQEAWAEGEQPNLTHRLSVDLNGPRGLFAEGRQQLAGEMQPGNPKTSGAFRR